MGFLTGKTAIITGAGRAVLSDGLQGVCRTGGIKPAAGRKQRREKAPIEFDEAKKNRLHFFPFSSIGATTVTIFP